MLWKNFKRINRRKECAMGKIKLKNTMFVVTHKTVEYKCNEPGYSYIGVSTNATNSDFYDNTFDNISIKNPNYCELTALYWIWKNVDCKNVGMCHYRRFFISVLDNKAVPVSIDDLDRILKEHDIIVPHVSYLDTTVKKHYERSVNNNGLDVICKFIAKQDPSYIPHIKKVLNARECFYCNMFYSKKCIIDKYCAWIFDILGQMESDVKMDGWNQYEQRLYGFLSEILFNIWVSHEHLSVAQHNFMKIENFPQVIHDGLDYQIKYKTRHKLQAMLWPLVKNFRNFRRIEW